MMSMLVLACVTMLPALVAPEVFTFGSCDASFDNFLDPIAHTQEGRVTLGSISFLSPAKVLFWDPSSTEKGFSHVEVTMDFIASTFSLSYNATGSIKQVNGSLSYVVTPKTMIQLKTTAGGNTVQNIFSFNEKGVADLYPLYISTTDVILSGCNPALLGRMGTLYLLSTQDYSSLDPKCIIQTVSGKAGMFKVSAVTHGP